MVYFSKKKEYFSKNLAPKNINKTVLVILIIVCTFALLFLKGKNKLLIDKN